MAHADSFAAAFAQHRYKEEMLADMRARWPNLLIGIGNSRSDDRAFKANRMLSLLLPTRSPRRFGEHSLLFDNWLEIACFFARHRELLTDPPRLEAVIERHDMELRSAFEGLTPGGEQ